MLLFYSGCIIKTLIIILLIFTVPAAFSRVKKETAKEKSIRLAENARIRKDAEEARTALESKKEEEARKIKEAEDIRKAEQASVTPDLSIAATNEYIATSWDQINRTVDTFFTNQSSPKLNKSSVFLSTSVTKREGEKTDTNVDFHLRIDLPNTAQKLKIIIEKQQDEIGNVLSDASVTSNKTVVKNGKTISQKDSHYTAGANFLLKQSKSFTSLLKFGIRIDMPLNPSLKMDLQKDFKNNSINISVLQKFIYYRQEGFQEISQLAFNKKLNETFQLDQINSLVWADENDDFLLRNSLILSQILGKEKMLLYSIGANARLSPTYYYESYDTSISYTQRLYQKWLYSTFTIGAEFPKERDFTDVKFVQLRLDIFFKEK